jgi:hypothetical protein
MDAFQIRSFEHIFSEFNFWKLWCSKGLGFLSQILIDFKTKAPDSSLLAKCAMAL